MRHVRATPVAVVALAILWILALAAAVAADFPPLTGRVVDNAGLLSPAERQRLSDKLARHEEATGNQVVVATLPDLGGRPIEDYANGLFRAWRLGQAGKDDGVLLLVAPKERRVRVEVGYGLEPVLTDAASKLIIARLITPAFREGRYADGIEAGVDAILDVVGGGEARATPAPPPRAPSQGGTTLDLASGLFLLFLILLVVWQNYRYRAQRAASDPWVAGGRRRRPGVVIIPGGWPTGGGWSGGGGGGGGWSGGGGSSGGGGASGDW